MTTAPGRFAAAAAPRVGNVSRCQNTGSGATRPTGSSTMIQHPASPTRCTIGTQVGISGVCVCDVVNDGDTGSASDSQTAARTGTFMHAIVREHICAGACGTATACTRRSPGALKLCVYGAFHIGAAGSLKARQATV